jgi:peptidoglycan hydrolase-like protein with peptidoglycan-binding domain
MALISASIRKYIHRFLICVCIFMPFSAQAEILTFDAIESQKENNGDNYNGGSWTNLEFKILNPVVGIRKYLNRRSISFTLDSDRNLNRTRTDIRIGTDWLRDRKFRSANNKWNNFWIGSGSLNGTQVSDLRTFDDDEKVVLAWIIANSDELINYALSKQKNMPKRSRLTWERMARGQKFERNVRRNLSASVRAALKDYDNFSHSKLILKNTLQPKLKSLKYYNGAIDGIGGPQTTKAIKAFEKANGLFVDGRLFGRERKLLVKLAGKSAKVVRQNDIDQNTEIATLKKRIDRLSVRISALIKENINLKSKINKAKQSNSSWDDDLKNTVRGQKNIILHMKKRISSLIKERNKLIEDKSGGSNKYLITSLENELNTLQIRYDVILKQRDKFRKAATQGGENLSATADNQRNIIKTLRERISSLSKERNTLLSEKNVALESQDKTKEANSKVLKLSTDLNYALARAAIGERQLAAEQDKYQNLYKKNNTIKVDFDKLDRKYKQLASVLKAKNNKDTESLQRLNEELSLSLQKQKILAYDAISQKSEVEKKLKITQTEILELNTQINDLSNIANSNSALKYDLSQARSQINSLNNKLNTSKNSASAKLAKTEAKIAILEEELEKSKNKFAELEKQKSSSKNGQQRGFVLSSEWDDLKQWITPQQIRFCTILSDYDLEKVAARESGNQLKQNLAIDNRDSDIDALLLGRNSQEKGYFRNWIGTVEQVFAIYQENSDGVEEIAAGVVIKTPCNSVTVGSGRVKSADDERYEGTAFPSDPIYTQLSDVSKGDPILFEGSLLTYQDTGEANRSSKPRFFTNVDSSVNDGEAEKAEKRDKINAPDYFVKIDYLSKL